MFNAFDARAKLRAIWQRLRPDRTDVRAITHLAEHHVAEPVADTPTAAISHQSHQTMSWETSTRGTVQ